MNRLIIIGNGFDLSHGLPTRYEDFVLDYLKSCLTERLRINNKDAFSGYVYKDSLIIIKSRINYTVTGKPKDNIHRIANMNDFWAWYEENGNLVNISYPGILFHKICNARTSWVDIEQVFYLELVAAISSFGRVRDTGLFKRVNSLNNEFAEIKKELEKYLYYKVEGERRGSLGDIYRYIELLRTHTDFGTDDFAEPIDVAQPLQTMALNFNYTSTISKYLDKENVINIHGELNNEKNPIIFGFGDELDEQYLKMERLNENEVFRHIKSFGYFQSSNYFKLLRFLGSPFQVYIFGHSCGLSDRTLLNHVFESDNCKSIKIFYHESKADYIAKTQEISRHFKDKAKMRSRIVPFDRSEPCPQFPKE